MNKEQIKAKLTDIIVDKLGIDSDEISYDPKQQFTSDLGADSLDTVEIVMALEDEFEIAIPDKEAQKLTTPKLAYDYLLKNVKS